LGTNSRETGLRALLTASSPFFVEI
jgi:hypothetical protein